MADSGDTYMGMGRLGRSLWRAGNEQTTGTFRFEILAAPDRVGRRETEYGVDGWQAPHFMQREPRPGIAVQTIKASMIKSQDQRNGSCKSINVGIARPTRHISREF
jgi:hypothetical protein